MNVLVIGSGGREHALAWKLKQSLRVGKLYCAPGNAGCAQVTECVAADVKDAAGLADLAQKLKADLTVVGPELPLVLGVADEFARHGLKLLGPTKAAAQLEGSKVFAKQFMQRHGIPTADFQACAFPSDAYSALCAVEWPVVIKVLREELAGAYRLFEEPSAGVIAGRSRGETREGLRVSTEPGGRRGRPATPRWG